MRQGTRVKQSRLLRTEIEVFRSNEPQICGIYTRAKHSGSRIERDLENLETAQDRAA